MNKELPRNLYKRGGQGTFVYAPDIAVFVATDKYGVQDLSNYVTSFSLVRRVNAPSTFTMQVDNKYGRFDRTIRRMDRVVVFLKRLSYLQVFSGYITEAPWETVVPGDVTISAECTIKRLMHTYWDPYAEQSRDFFPMLLNREWKAEDGGAAASIFLLMTIVAGWDKDKIQIQKIPKEWVSQAAEVLTNARNEFLGSNDFQTILSALKKLVDADGWAGYLRSVGMYPGDLFGETGASSNAVGDGMTDADVEWQKKYGKSRTVYPTGVSIEFASGFVPLTAMKKTGLQDRRGKEIILRPDAASALKSLVAQYGKYLTVKDSNKLEVSFSYLTYKEQKQYIDGHTIKRSDTATGTGGCETSLGKMCPAGLSDHGWGTVIDFNSKSEANSWAKGHQAIMNRFGWYEDTFAHPVDPDTHWVFKGNWATGFPSYTKKRPKNAPRPPESAQDWQTASSTNDIPGDQWQVGESINPEETDSIFNVAFFAPQVDPASNAYVGKMAWINDVPLLQSISQLSAAAMRDFQSAPNGDFVAFYPDRLGAYGKFPIMQVRDIEVMDFKLSINDSNMATHVIAVGDVTAPEPRTGISFDALIGSGMVTIEQTEIMKMVFGLKTEQSLDGFASEFMEKFGLRPYREDAFQIRDIGWLWLVALHRWEQAWANQWMARVTFTFMPELYPGMRIQLMDREPNLAVYVEQVTHTGSRTGGFNTQAIVSTPMIKKGKNADGTDRWVMMKAEVNPAGFGLEEEALGRNATLNLSDNPELLKLNLDN